MGRVVPNSKSLQDASLKRTMTEVIMITRMAGAVRSSQPKVAPMQPAHKATFPILNSTSGVRR